MPSRRVFIVCGEPDYDDSMWIDSVHSTRESAEARVNEDMTPTGRKRRGDAAIFPHGVMICEWIIDGSEVNSPYDC